MESQSRIMGTDHTIRVFISSTFRDMQADRDHLVKFTFPQLRKLCESRGVTWGEVDLRWGITDEEKAEGKVLPLCLEEIHRCRPYFIGLLGERYGWIPDAIPPEVLELEAWMREPAVQRKSVTELEILHGVLNNAQMANHAFFYFRDPKYIEQFTPGERVDFLSEDVQSAEKLKGLKERIRQNGFPVREDYPNPKALGDLVLEDFTALIETLYPAGQEPSLLDRESTEHEAFARSRAQIYVGRQEYFDRLDKHVASDGPPLVVVGKSGVGKSALLANWFIHHRVRHPTGFALIHFIGGTPDSTDLIRLLRRIMLELKRSFPSQFTEAVPSDVDEILERFREWFARMAEGERITLILDGLDQLEDRHGAPELGWLPVMFPANCRMIFSTLPARSLDAIRRREWQEMTVEPLTISERTYLLEKLLSQYSRRLSPARSERITSAEQSANPLFLRALLDELRQFGEHEGLGERIEYYLAAKDPGELYERILERWEIDFSGDQDLVRRSFSLVWAARRGLSEAELLDLLGENNLPLPRAHWTPLFLAAESSLTQRSGLLGFFHDYLRNAVRERFLRTTDAQQAQHGRLAEYFDRQNQLDGRKLDELPWHLEKSGNLERLKACMADTSFLMKLLTGRETDATQYFKALSLRYNLEQEYADALNGEATEPPSQELAYRYLIVGRFLEMLDCPATAEQYMRRALAIDEDLFGPNHVNVARDATSLALLIQRTNREAEAEPLLQRVLTVATESANPNPADTASALQNLGLLYSCSWRHAEAENYYRRALATALAALQPNDPCLPPILFNLAICLHAMNRSLEAEAFERQALALGEQVFGPSHPHVALYLNQLATTLRASRPLEAERLARRAEQIYRDTFGENDVRLAAPLTTIAHIYQFSYRLTEAERLLRRALELTTSQKSPDDAMVAFALENVAEVVRMQNRPAEATELLSRSIQHWAAAPRVHHYKLHDLKSRLERIQVPREKGRWRFWM